MKSNLRSEEMASYRQTIYTITLGIRKGGGGGQNLKAFYFSTFQGGGQLRK